MSSGKIDGGQVCLVLGGLGFLGSHLADALLRQGNTVKLFDRPQIKSVKGIAESGGRVSLIEGDLLSAKDIDFALQGVDVCYHLISTTLPGTSNLDPAYDVETNVVGTIRLLDAAVRHGVKKIVFSSSGGTIYGIPKATLISEDHPTDPICAYGVSKLAIEKYLDLYHRLHGLNYSVLRLANPYGERQRTNASQGAVAVFLGKALRNQTIEIWGDGNVVRDYMHVSDTVNALYLASQAAQPTLCNIGSGRGVSINELLSVIETSLGRKLSVNYVPGRGFDVPRNVLDISRAQSLLGWTPKIELDVGIHRTIDWLRNGHL
jgi:UDP-glucose 4-epimerase